MSTIPGWWKDRLTLAAVLLAVVVGGCGQGQGGARPLGVARLDQVAALARVDVPLSMRRDALVVAAGGEVLVIGGRAPGIKDPGPGGRIRQARYLADGARLDVRSGRWWSMPPIPVGPLHDPAGVWTGEELVVVGSPCGAGSGWLVGAEPPEKVCRPGGLWVGAYSPRRKRWRTIERRSAAAKGSETDEDVAWEVFPRVGRDGRRCSPSDTPTVCWGSTRRGEPSAGCPGPLSGREMTSEASKAPVGAAGRCW